MTNHTSIAFHPEFPTVQQAKDNPSLISSNHVPFLTTIPLTPEYETKEISEIKFVSWNVHEHDGVHGYAPVNSQFWPETPNEREARHLRMAESLKLFALKHKPHFITLQEIQAEDLFSIIGTSLGDEYGEVKVDGEVLHSNGCITLYNINYFKPITPPNLSYYEYIDKSLGGNKIDFAMLENEKFTLSITNINAPFNNHPLAHELKIKNIHTEAKATLAVTIGILNCSIAPLDSSIKNIISSVSIPTGSIISNDLDPASSEGCIYSYLPANKYYQSEIHHLNTKTGDIYDISELPALDSLPVNSIINEEIQKIRSYQMILCLDESYQSKTLNKEDQDTIFSYEATLKTELDDINIAVRFAKNLSNGEAIAIHMNTNLYNHLRLVSRRNHHFQFNKNYDSRTGRNFCAAYAPCEFIKPMKDHIQHVINNRQLIENEDVVNFAKNILALGHSDHVTQEVKQKFAELYTALTQSKTNLLDAPHSIILKHFSHEAVVYAKNPKYTIADLEKSCHKLDKKLYGKPPMNSKVKIALCGLLGAIVGAIIGLAIGAFITSYAYGVGALPGAMLGAIKGFSLGSAFAIGLGIGGYYAGEHAGLFFSKKSEAKFNTHKENVNHTIDPDVLRASFK